MNDVKEKPHTKSFIVGRCSLVRALIRLLAEKRKQRQEREGTA